MYKILLSFLTALSILLPVHAQAFETRGSLVRLRADNSPLSLFTTQSFLMSSDARPLATDQDLYVVSSEMEAIQGNLAIESITPNFVRHLFKSTPSEGKAWGIEKIGMPALWAKGMKGSRDIVVAVIDTGVEYTHPEIKANIWSAADGTHGYNAVTKSLDPMDDHSHGTHCSGTIGGKDVGVNKLVSIMGVKFLSKDGSGDDAGAIDSINWAAAHGANVMSASWGGGGADPELEAAIKRAGDKGILFVAAAGNDTSDNDKQPSYPASIKLDNIISVAATDEKDGLAGFSNWGATSVHVAAPGVNIYSSVLGGKYASYSGTSMATPHVSGVVAMMLSQGVKPGDVKEALIKLSAPVKALKRKSVSGGRVDAFAAVTGKKGEPTQPQDPSEPSDPQPDPGQGIPPELCELLKKLGLPCQM
jgi:thermitase